MNASDKENCIGSKKQECIVEEVLFNGDEDYDTAGQPVKNPTEGSGVGIGTAEFKSPLDNNDTKESIGKTNLKEKDAHIEILRKLLTKAMKIIKSLRDQINLITSKKGTKPTKIAGKGDDILSGEVTEGNLDEIGNFLDALHNVANSENEKLLYDKVELLAEKYGDEAKSLAETLVKLTNRTLGGSTNQFASPNKLIKNTKPAAMIDPSLSPIETPGKSPGLQHMSVHNEIMDLYRQAEEDMEKKNVKETEREKGSLQMTFQQDDNEKEGKNISTKRSEEPGSTSRSIRNWKTFVAGAESNNSETEEEKEAEQEKKTRKQNQSSATGGGMRRDTATKKKENKEVPSRAQRKSKMTRENDDDSLSEERSTNRGKQTKTDHKKFEESLSVQSQRDVARNPNNDTMDENLTNIEAAMSNFLGGFKDIKSELSQIGEAMQNCSQIQHQKSAQSQKMMSSSSQRSEAKNDEDDEALEEEEDKENEGEAVEIVQEGEREEEAAEYQQDVPDYQDE